MKDYVPSQRPTTTLVSIELELMEAGDEVLRLLETPGLPLDDSEVAKAVEGLQQKLIESMDKRDRMAEYLQFIDSQIELRKNQAKQKEYEAKGLEKLRTWLRRYVIGVMDTLGETRLPGKEWTMRKHTNSAAALVVNAPDLLPERFYKEVTERKLDRAMLKAELEEGQPPDVPREVAYLDRGAHLRIK